MPVVMLEGHSMLRRLLDEETAGGDNEVIPREEGVVEAAADGVSPAPEGNGIAEDMSNAMNNMKDNAVEQLSNCK